SVTVHLGEPRTHATATGDPLRPLNHYAITKFYGEQVAWWYANAGRLSTVCWRLGQPYPVDFFGLSHLDKPENRTLAVTSRDLAAGFAAGLTADLSQDDWPDADRDRSAGHLRPIAGFALGHLVSASDVPAPTGYDLTVSARLGYEPRDRMTSRGPVPRGGDGGGG
ncbi:MAG: NAD-dependent epimerase/dehydratase family protein, partial [Planctomycetota bacterium]